VLGGAGVLPKGAITDARRDEAAQREHERDRDQLGPEANYRTPPGGSV
jgi:hypothetical protein